MRVCKAELEKRIIPETRNMKSNFYLILCLLLLLPSKAFSYSEDSGGGQMIFLVFLLFSIVWTIRLIVSAVRTNNKNCKAVIIIGGLIGGNIVLMFDSIAWFYVSFLTLPMLFGLLLIEFYDL